MKITTHSPQLRPATLTRPSAPKDEPGDHFSPQPDPAKETDFKSMLNIGGRALLGAGLGCIPVMGGLTTGLGGCLSGERYAEKHGDPDSSTPKLVGLSSGALVGTLLNVVGVGLSVQTGSLLPMIPSAVAGALAWAYSGT